MTDELHQQLEYYLMENGILDTSDILVRDKTVDREHDIRAFLSGMVSICVQYLEPTFASIHEYIDSLCLNIDLGSGVVRFDECDVSDEFEDDKTFDILNGEIRIPDDFLPHAETVMMRFSGLWIMISIIGLRLSRREDPIYGREKPERTT